MTLIYKLRVYLISTLAVILIVMAVAFTAIRAFLPHATEYAADIQKLLSSQVGLPVTIDAIDADMSWFTPRLKLINVVVMDKDGVNELIRLDEAIFALAYVDSIFNLSPVIGEIHLIGADLYIERYPEDRWVVQGIEFTNDEASAPSGKLEKLIKNTNFSLLDSDIHYTDYVRKKEMMDFIGVNVVLESFLGSHSLAIDVQLPSGFGDSLLVIASINGDYENYEITPWEVYLEGATINVEHWMKEFGVKGIPLLQGTLDGKVWLSVENNTISRVSSDISVNNFKLTNKMHAEHKWDVDYLSLKFDWRQLTEGWRIDAKDLVLVKNNNAWKEATHITAIKNDTTGLRATATYLRPFDLLGLPGVFLVTDNLSEMEKMQSIFLGGELYNIALNFPVEEGQIPEIEATFLNVDLKLVDTDIKIFGIDGVVKFKKGRVDLELFSESVVADFGDMFREPILADFITGEIVARHENYNWIIESSDIYLLNQDIEARSRVKTVLHIDGEIVVDLQTDFSNAKGMSAYKYYPLPVMSSELVEWLDSGITDGNVKRGSFVLFGDVGKFPYDDNDGVMEVVFSGEDLTLHFYDGWPDIQNLTADVRFYNSSLSIENGTGRTYRGNIENATAMIPDLNVPVLFVNGDITAPAEDMQKYIWNSGLDETLGDAMRQFQVDGDIELKLSLEIPLDEGEVKVKSDLIFSDNEMYFPEMEYLLSGVTGKLSFTEDEIEGSNISATFDGAPVEINAHSEHEKESSGNVFHLTGHLPIDSLMKRLEWVPHYWLSGSSDWDMILHIPGEAQEYLVKIEMQSTLEGVAIDVSDALSKERDDILHVELGISVLHEGIQIDIDSDRVVNLFATRDDEANWDFIIDSKLIRGSGEFAESLGKDSSVVLRLESISLNALTYSSDPSRPVSLDPTIFPSLDISAKNLVWDDWNFRNARLETVWNKHGMLINEVSIEGSSFKVSGHGSWLNKWNDTDETSLEFTVRSSDLGNMLSSLGISDSVNRGEAVEHVSWQWPAEPYNFSLGTIHGVSNFEVKSGGITNLKPGTGGRLLGLFNAFKIADRLALDFDDVYKEGFKFDSIKGEYKYDDGSAETDGILVKAAAADLKLTGRIGIVDRDYDMVVQVQPHTSGAVFTGVALLGGLVTGAAAVLANKVFGLDRWVHDTYTVTGPWDDPVVVQIAKGAGDDSESGTGFEDDE